jgi:hypothetical protein
MQCRRRRPSAGEAWPRISSRAHQYHDLFDVRLMQARRKAGQPIIWTKTMEDLPEPARTAGGRRFAGSLP